MEDAKRRPLIAISACRSEEGIHPFNRVSEKYILAILDPTCGIPIIIPAIQDMGSEIDHSDYIDGLLLTGSPSNVRPVEYSGTPSVEGTKHDIARDKTMIPLIRRCLQKKIPILGLCLGIQELNVACGGSLHQRIFDLEDKFDHRMRRDVDDHAKRYRPAHNIRITEGGLLNKITGEEEVNVNSLHAQGIDQLGEDLTIEAVAPDGIIEAVSFKNADQFALGVQWHAEWPRPIRSFNEKIFRHFGKECRSYAENKKI
tara:strand:+ start:170 stop:940 length:771 start_codon:yes stop_codon:yes gene_type:complete